MLDFVYSRRHNLIESLHTNAAYFVIMETVEIRKMDAFANGIPHAIKKPNADALGEIIIASSADGCVLPTRATGRKCQRPRKTEEEEI